MFTGIITDLGRLRRLRRGPRPEGGCELTIETAYPVEEIALGASIACSGPCLTVIAVEPGAFYVKTADSYIKVTEWSGYARPRTGDRLT